MGAQHRAEMLRAQAGTFGAAGAFGSFSVDDLEAAEAFYGQSPRTADLGLLTLHLVGGRDVLVYAKPDHAPASFTIRNFSVADIDRTMGELTARGVRFERYEGLDQDDAGVDRSAGVR